MIRRMKMGVHIKASRRGLKNLLAISFSLFHFLFCAAYCAAYAGENEYIADLVMDGRAKQGLFSSGVTLSLRIRNAGGGPLPVYPIHALLWEGLAAAVDGEEAFFIWKEMPENPVTFRNSELWYTFPAIYLTPGRYSLRVDYAPYGGGVRLTSNALTVDVPIPADKKEMARILTEVFSERESERPWGLNADEQFLSSRLHLISYKNPPAALECFSDAMEMMLDKRGSTFVFAKRTLLLNIGSLARNNYAEEFNFKPAFIPPERLLDWFEREHDFRVQYSLLMMLGTYKPVFNERTQVELERILKKARNSVDGDVRYAAYFATWKLFDVSQAQKEIWLREVEAASNIRENDKKSLQEKLSK